MGAPQQQGSPSGGKLLTVSNRGPYEYQTAEDGELVAVPGQGGLSTALRTAASFHPTTWLSSAMTDEDRAIAAGEATPARPDGSSRFVLTSPEIYDLYYGAFSNEALWFLQHGLPFPEELTAKRIEEAWRDGYMAVNRSFGDAICDELASDGYIAVMLHDYHFYLAPLFVREQAEDVYLQQFIHIPWPAASEWARLPRRIVAEICRGLASNDSLAFQTAADAGNFLATCAAFLPEAFVDSTAGLVVTAARKTRVWHNPISVDPDELAATAETSEFSQYRYLLRAGPRQKTIMRVDRLDPTKNVIRGFEAYAELLERHPELREQVYFLALLQPTKSGIEVYQRYQDETHRLADEINRRFGNLHWKPIRLLFEHNRVQALAAMSLYDVLLVNSLADGMNLVAKEAPLLNTHDGVLVLSTRAGAYEELACGASGIDPWDVGATADALYEALTMPVEERRRRARLLREIIRKRDLRDWFGALMKDVEEQTGSPQAAASK